MLVRVSGLFRLKRPSGISVNLLAAALLWASVQMPATVLACPFCLAPPETWSEILGDADIVLVGEIVEQRYFRQQIKADVSCETVFRVKTLLKNVCHDKHPATAVRGLSLELRKVASPDAEVKHIVGSSRIQTGSLITIQENLTGKPGDLFLLSGLQAEPRMSGRETYSSDQTDVTAGNVAALPQSPERQDAIIAGSDVDAEVRSGSDVVRAVVTSELDVSVTPPAITSEKPVRSVRLCFLLPELIEWNSPAELNSELLDYVASAPPESLPSAIRLPYYVRFLENSNSEIAADAWGEFARSSYADVCSIKHLFPKDQLRNWIASPDTSPERLGLYGMMLGLCGNADDADFLEQQIGTAKKASDYRFGSDGLMGGYLLLTGERGLKFLEDTRLRQKHVNNDEIFSVMQAVQFIWSYESDLISRDLLRKSMHLLLDNEQLREVAITNLSRWKDWDTAPGLIERFDALESSDPRSQEAIIGFMIAMRRDTGPEKANAELLAAADSFLNGLEVRNPKLLQAAYRQVGPAPKPAP